MVADGEIHSSEPLVIPFPNRISVRGVYVIHCDANDRYYVGSSNDIKTRAYYHEWQLRSGTHANIKLQRAYDKYGPKSFRVSIVQVCDSDESMIAAELQWISDMNSVRDGFNIKNSPGEVPKMPAVRESVRYYKLISPTGEIHEGHNLTEFCRKNGMERRDANTLGAVMNGRRLAYRGWTAFDGRGRKRDLIESRYAFIDPDGNEHRGTNLKSFCLKNALSYIAMGNVNRGRQNFHKGWSRILGEPLTHRSIIQDKQKTRSLVSPSGEIHTFSNVSRFCVENGLNPNSVNCLIRGRTKTHRGWRISECM